MTLFHLIQNETDIFMEVLEKYFDGKICRRTVKFIEGDYSVRYNSKEDKFTTKKA